VTAPVFGVSPADYRRLANSRTYLITYLSKLHVIVTVTALLCVEEERYGVPQKSLRRVAALLHTRDDSPAPNRFGGTRSPPYPWLTTQAVHGLPRSSGTGETMIGGRQCSHREPGPTRTSTLLSEQYEGSRESGEIPDGIPAKLRETRKTEKTEKAVNALCGAAQGCGLTAEACLTPALLHPRWLALPIP
jgi:hypothetical protein